MIVTEVVIARHGNAVCNAAGLVGGPATCTGLTQQGRHESDRLARRLAVEHRAAPFTAFYATDRLRVTQTAQIVARAIGVQPTVLPALRGLDHGAADGRPWTEVKDEFGGPPQHDPARPIADGAESWQDYLHRAGSTLAGLLLDATGKILIVAHGETVEAAHHHLMALPDSSPARFGFAVGHTAVSRWQLQRNRLGQQRWLLIAHNDTAHLHP